MEHLWSILGGGFGVVLVAILLIKIYQHTLHNTTKAATLFFLVVILPVTTIGGVFLYIGSLQKAEVIARGKRPDILPFRAHSDPRLAQAQRVWTNKCRLSVVRSKIDPERTLPYVFEVPNQDAARMPEGNPAQYYWCFDSKNPEYRGCYFRNPTFLAALEIDRDLGRLAKNARTRCDIREVPEEEIPNWPVQPRVVHRLPHGDLTWEAVTEAVARWEANGGPDAADDAITAKIKAWRARRQAASFTKSLRHEFRKKFR